MADFSNYEKPEAQIKSGPDLSVENLPEQAPTTKTGADHL